MENRKSYNELILIIGSYMNNDDLKLVNDYYNEAVSIYEGMKRKTGEDYIEHSIEVSKILAKLNMDAITIGSALIHEAITLGVRTPQEIKDKFGLETEIILSSIAKLSNLKRTFTKVNDSEKYRRIVVGLSENPRALFIKLADRLHNLRSLYVHDDEHKNAIIDETLNIFIPIAHRLGIKTMKSELEDLCLQYSKPKEYNDILEKINADKEELEKDLNQMQEEIIELLNQHDIEFEILSRIKSVRGIYNKLASGKKWNNIYDLLGLRILVNKTEECYLVMGLIHSKYRPIANRFKDYIASPKHNMYQSLHTTVFGVEGRVYEIQVRTYEMNEVAEHGVASHWSYKEKTDGSKKSEVENKLEAFKTLIELKDLEGNLDFFKNLDINLNKGEIYVFTPKGDIIELPVGATPIDFAYKIHSEVGNTCIGAIVNGKMQKLDHELQDSDIVELKCQKGKGPSKSWLKIVKTDQAKSRIKSYFYKKDREKLIETGEDLLINEIKKRKYNVNEVLKEEFIDEVCKDLKIETTDELYMGISSLKFSTNSIANKLINLYEPEKENELEKLFNNIVKTNNKGNVIVLGCEDILTNIASCCNPVYGEEIIGYITKGSGVSVHKSNCINVKNLTERIVEVAWNENQKEKFTTKILIYSFDSNENLVDIITSATKLDINIISINFKKKVNNDSIYEVLLKVSDIDTLNIFMNNLNALKFISKVERGSYESSNSKK